jgi:hypothetical protein
MERFGAGINYKNDLSVARSASSPKKSCFPAKALVELNLNNILSEFWMISADILAAICAYFLIPTRRQELRLHSV